MRVDDGPAWIERSTDYRWNQPHTQFPSGLIDGLQVTWTRRGRGLEENRYGRSFGQHHFQELEVLAKNLRVDDANKSCDVAARTHETFDESGAQLGPRQSL